MGKASSSKKVARAARTGGGRTRRGSSSWLWPALMAVIVVLGTAGVVYSREQRAPDNSRPVASGAGRQGDHWHAAIGFYICGTFQPNISEAADPLGIHTHDDGIVHIHPFVSRAAGKNAKLGVFFDTVDAKVSSTELRLPGQDTHKNGEKCGDDTANVQVKIWPNRNPDTEGTLFKGDPGDVRLDGQPADHGGLRPRRHRHPQAAVGAHARQPQRRRHHPGARRADHHHHGPRRGHHHGDDPRPRIPPPSRPRRRRRRPRDPAGSRAAGRDRHPAAAPHLLHPEAGPAHRRGAR